MNTKTIKIGSSISIDFACQEAVRVAKLECCNVEFEFNGKTLTATPNTDPNVLANSYFQNRELCDVENSVPVLSGRWRHSHGTIFCGTLRIAKADFDTNPHPDFCARLFDYICRTMNEKANL